MKSIREEPTYSFEDWEWIGEREGRSWLDSFIEEQAKNRDPMPRLRARLGDDRASLLAYQVELRTLAARKFAHPENWLWTRTLLEQASDEFSSRLVASLIPPTAAVVDWCSGAAADGIAIAQRAPSIPMVRCRDSSRVACTIARHNFAAHRLPVSIECVEAGQDWGEGNWIHMDPDRRSDGFRTTELGLYSPNEALMNDCIERTSAGSIKLAPATEIPTTWSERLGRHYIGVGKSVRQQRVWWGTDFFRAGTTTVSVMKESDHWHHVSFSLADIHDNFERIVPTPDEMEWIGDVDPAVRAAHGTLFLAKLCDATVIGDEHGYLASAKHHPSWFVDWFQVQDRLSLDIKRLRKHLRSKNIGQLEIKKRGVDIDIEAMRKDLRLEGDESATLILVRDGKKRFAVLAKRV